MLDYKRGGATGEEWPRLPADGAPQEAGALAHMAASGMPGGGLAMCSAVSRSSDLACVQTGADGGTRKAFQEYVPPRVPLVLLRAQGGLRSRWPGRAWQPRGQTVVSAPYPAALGGGGSRAPAWEGCVR